MTVSKDTTFLLLHTELSNTSKQLKEHKEVLENLVVENSQLKEGLWERKRGIKTCTLHVYLTFSISASVLVNSWQCCFS